jgi:hypothetical protein
MTLGDEIRVYAIQGDLADQLAGAGGIRRVESADETHDDRHDQRLVGGKPTMIDDVSVDHRKVVKAVDGAGEPFTRFRQAPIKVVAPSSRVALIFTPAVGRNHLAEGFDMADTLGPEPSPTSAVGTILSDFQVLFRRNSLFIGPTRPPMAM